MKIGSAHLFILFCLLFFIPPIHAQNALKIDSLLSLLNSSKEDTNRVIILNQLSESTKDNDPTQAKLNTKEAISLAELLNYKKGLATSYKINGMIEFNHGNYNEALGFYLKSLQFSQELNDKNGISHSYNNIGIVYSYLGNYPLATDYYLKSLSIYDELGNKNGMANANVNIGFVYYNQEQYMKALEFFNKGLKLYEVLKDKTGMVKCQINIGGIQQTLNHYSEALKFYEKALKTAEEIGDKREMSIAYNNTGVILTDQGHFTEAMDYLSKGLYLSKEMDDKEGIASAYICIGDLYEKQLKYEPAIDYTKKGLALARQIGAKYCVSDAYKGLAKIYSESGNYNLAFQYQQSYISIKDTLQSEKSRGQIAEMQAKYETEKKNNLINILTQEKAINEQEANKQRIIKYSLLGISSLFILIILLVLNRYRLKQIANRTLKEKNEQILNQKNEIEGQRDLLFKKNLLISDSISYAKRIQKSLLPSHKLLTDLFPDSFIFSKPKDKVSGDFFWLHETDKYIFFSAADCTGHGVPGAFMSIVGFNLLEQAIKIKQLNDPGSILEELIVSLSSTLKNNDEEDIQEGIDLAICRIEKNTNELLFAGINNGMYIISGDQLTEVKATKIMGRNFKGKIQNHQFTLKKGDLLYLFTDGFIDQRGGALMKKFYYEPFKQLLKRIKEEKMEDQKNELKKTMKNWMGSLDQTDDMCVVGIRI